MSPNSSNQEFRPLENRELTLFLEIARGGSTWTEIARLLNRDEAALRENIARILPHVAQRLSELGAKREER